MDMNSRRLNYEHYTALSIRWDIGFGRDVCVCVVCVCVVCLCVIIEGRRLL